MIMIKEKHEIINEIKIKLENNSIENSKREQNWRRIYFDCFYLYIIRVFGGMCNCSKFIKKVIEYHIDFYVL